MARFQGKIVIVTGAASGIGEGAARRFAKDGATLVLGDKDSTGLQALADDLAPATVATRQTDVSQMADCEALVALAVERFGRLDDRLVFVVGSPRSGTTFLAGAIGALPGFVDLGEVGHLNPASGYGEWPCAVSFINELATGAAASS